MEQKKSIPEEAMQMMREIIGTISKVAETGQPCKMIYNDLIITIEINPEDTSAPHNLVS